MSDQPLGIAWGFLYGVPGVKAETFLPQVRALGGGCTKVYLLWSQIEPEKGRYDWSAVDAYVGQLQSPEEGLIALFSTSMWATRRSALMLPPSPAKNPDDYYQFVHDLVTRCKRRVRYWQNDSEPNSPIYWDGTADDFIAQLKVFYRAVKDADPQAVVVCGGYDGLFNPPGMWAFPGQEHGLAFFDQVMREAKDAFDLFDVRLYADPYTIPARVEYLRQRMADRGYQKPMICTEYNGPSLFEFAENRKYVALVASWSSAITDADATMQDAQRKRQATAVADLYIHREDLAPQTQMFLDSCPQPLDDKLRRIQCRDLVMRNVLALSAGIEQTMFWDLWHDTSDRNDLMHLMFGKLKMMDYDAQGKLATRYPVAEAFRRTAEALRGVESVTRCEIPDRPSLYAFDVRRRGRDPLLIVWERRDAFTGEDMPPVPFEYPWTARDVSALDALGETVRATVTDGRLHLPVSVTPIFIEPAACPAGHAATSLSV